MGKSPKEVAEELGVRSELVRRWRREYEQNQPESFPGQGKVHLTAEEAQIARLKKELKEVKIERDILKKAVSIFSRNDGKSTGS